MSACIVTPEPPPPPPPDSGGYILVGALPPNTSAQHFRSRPPEKSNLAFTKLTAPLDKIPNKQNTIVVGDSLAADKKKIGIIPSKN